MSKHLAVDDNADIINRYRCLGLFEERPIPFEKGSSSDVLLDRMMEKMFYAPHESDMIIVHIEVEAEFADRREKRFACPFHKFDPRSSSSSRPRTEFMSTLRAASR